MMFKQFLVLCLFLGSLFCVAIQDADAARRFGGGKSFGNKQSVNRSSTTTTKQSGVTQNSATQQKKGGFLGGAGGMIGGLLAGTLLGSLLFGGDFGGSGFMDILMLGLLAFLAFKLYSMFKKRKPMENPAGAAYGGYAGNNANFQGQNPQNMQFKSVDNYQQNTQSSHNQGWSGLAGGSAQSAPEIPANFDVQNFLEGAKMAFTRMQNSWDKRDIDDIALFTTPAVLAVIQAQLAEDDSVGSHEVLLNNAQLLRVSSESGNEMATVYFDVVMREASEAQTMQVRELWHFTRPLSGGNWKIDGIQQMED